MSKYTADDNRSMQLNDNNDRYYSSRGIDRYDDDDDGDGYDYVSSSDYVRDRAALNARCSAWSEVFKRIEEREKQNERDSHVGEILEHFEEYSIYHFGDGRTYKLGDKVVNYGRYRSGQNRVGPEEGDTGIIEAFFWEQAHYTDDIWKADARKQVARVRFSNGETWLYDLRWQGFVHEQVYNDVYNESW